MSRMWLQNPSGDNMVRIEEVHELSIVIPVIVDKFYDDKEISELFAYAFDNSRIHNIYHYPNTFKRIYERGDEPYKFTVAVESHNAETIPKVKKDLEELVDVYNQFERDYLRLRVFGDIESKMMIRRGTVKDD